MANTTWTKKEFDDEVNRHYQDMKKHGFSKSDCKKDILNVMKDNKITLSNKKC